MAYYKGEDTIQYLDQNKFYNRLFVKSFAEWLVQYCENDFSKLVWADEICKRCKNKKLYGKLSERTEYTRAVIDFIAGMTDVYAINAFNELLEC